MTLITVLIILGVSLYSFFGKYARNNFPEPPEILANDSKPISLPAKGAYGYFKKDRIHPDKVIYSFSYDNDDNIMLHYQVAGIKTPGEIAILLNNTKIGETPKSANWSHTLNLDLPSQLLQSGDNMLTFDNTLNPPKSSVTKLDSWGIRDVYLTREKKIACQQDKAKFLFEQGKLKYEERKISYGNLYEAVQKLKMAQKHIENCSQSIPLSQEINNEYLLAWKELNKEIENYVFEAKRAQRLKNNAAFKNSVKIIKQLLPNKDDPLYIETVNKIKQK